jgi:hypothetical protein
MDGWTPLLVDLHEAGRIGQIVLLIEAGQVAGAEIGRRAVHQAWIVVGVDDGDGLSGPIAGQGAKPDVGYPVPGTDLLRSKPDGR